MYKKESKKYIYQSISIHIYKGKKTLQLTQQLPRSNYQLHVLRN
jgi:hypothetical protein